MMTKPLQDAPVAHPLPIVTSHGTASAPVGLPFGQAHLCPGDRRPRAVDRWPPPRPTKRKARRAKTWNVDAARSVGKKIAERALAKGVKQVVFDRGGYIYHGRIKALADAAREGGLEF